MNRADAQKTTLRMPPDIAEWLKMMAARKISSMTTELVRVCRERMAQDRRAERRPEVAGD